MDIKELIERVAKQLCSIDNGEWDSSFDTTRTLFDGSPSKEEYRRRAQLVLNDPDLYVKGKMLTENPFAEEALATGFCARAEGYQTAYRDIRKAGYLPVIPLREAMKEAQDD